MYIKSASETKRMTNRGIMSTIQAKKHKNKKQIFKQTKSTAPTQHNQKFLIELSAASVRNLKTLELSVLFLIVG